MLNRPARATFTFLMILAGVSGRGHNAVGKKDPDAGKVVVYRDEYGVPHIFAPTVEGGAYAVGYAQAEDRLEELLRNILRGTGEMAAAFGAEELNGDIQNRMWRHYEIARKNFNRIRPEVRRYMAAYVQGVNDYLTSHKSEIPAWWGERKLDVYMSAAHGRQFMWGWPSGQALGELRAAGINPNFSADLRSSNQMAIAPWRTSVKAPILIIDPHLSWWGATRFWEFRIHAGELSGSGFTIPGNPYIGLGHTDYTAWAMTTGGPDTADVYVLTLNPENPLQYRYDDSWKTLTPRTVQISVKGEGKPREVTFYDSHNGPVVARVGNKAYVAKLAYADEVQYGEAFWLFNMARNVEDFRKALDLNQIMPQNVMVADTSGNIYYQRTGRVPIRPDGYDFSKPVDGSTSKTEWLGIHPARDLISIENPAQGYMQNCNIPPDVMMVNSTLTLDQKKIYMFNQPAGRTHQRAAQAVQVLHKDNSVTPEEAIALALDNYCYQYERWTDALKKAEEKYGAEYKNDSDYQEGLREILSWNGRSDPDSKNALKYYYWRQGVKQILGAAYRDLIEKLADYMEALGKPNQTREVVSDPELKALIAGLAQAMKTMRQNHNSLDVVYGQVFRVGREDKSWPVGGGSLGEEGMATLRAIGFGNPRNDHTRWGGGGQTSTQVVLLTRPVRSWTQPPIGQSDRSDSPFFRDQAEKLFSPGKMKPTWYEKSELLKHVHSRTELKYVPPAPAN
jgi:acyl-homoserine lactone acylase PvdQ